MKGSVIALIMFDLAAPFVELECISVPDNISQDVCLCLGVPEVSVLGPNNCCMYTRPVGEIIRRHNIKYNFTPIIHK